MKQYCRSRRTFLLHWRKQTACACYVHLFNAGLCCCLLQWGDLYVAGETRFIRGHTGQIRGTDRQERGACSAPSGDLCKRSCLTQNRRIVQKRSASPPPSERLFHLIQNTNFLQKPQTFLTIFTTRHCPLFSDVSEMEAGTFTRKTTKHLDKIADIFSIPGAVWRPGAPHSLCSSLQDVAHKKKKNFGAFLSM